MKKFIVTSKEKEYEYEGLARLFKALEVILTCLKAGEVVTITTDK